MSAPRREPPPADTTTVHDVTLYGHRVRYLEAGRGPTVVLLHGITGSSATWMPALPGVVGNLHVVAPDLLGHGESAKPRGDYSLGAFATGIRDLLSVLGVDRATIVGHSLGGGIAMQFAYQFPQATERLVLVASGGLGREVSPLLRAAALPGAEWVLPLLCSPAVRDSGRAVGRLLGRLPVPMPPGLVEVARGFASLAETEARGAFVHTLRGVIDLRGQRVDARDRFHLAGQLPTLLVWGGRDRIIPVGHGRDAHALAPGSRLEIFEGAGHFPHVDEPERFARVLVDFIEGTTPGRLDPAALRDLITVPPPATDPDPAALPA